jgi:hypothetical protein
MNIRRSQERDKKAIPPGGLKAKDPNTRRPTRIFHFPNGHGDKHAENYDKEGSSWFSPGHPAEIHSLSPFSFYPRTKQRDKFHHEILSKQRKEFLCH